MSDSIVTSFVSRYRSFRLNGTSWSTDQITSLEKHLGLALPPSYKAYLHLCGDSPPASLVGSDCHSDYLFDLNEWGRELLDECGNPFELTKNEVVFLMHQGYQFLYFKAEQTIDDPPVYFFLEGFDAPELRHDKFSEWVKSIA